MLGREPPWPEMVCCRKTREEVMLCPAGDRGVDRGDTGREPAPSVTVKAQPCGGFVLHCPLGLPLLQGSDLLEGRAPQLVSIPLSRMG